jgi:formylglycine-generating enzyme required for sulfatase activity
MGADIRAVVKRLDKEPDVTIRRAVLLSLGEFDEKELAPGERKLVMAKLFEVYRTAADPGLHAAAEWLLRQWKQGQKLKEIEQEWVKDKAQRQQRLEGIRQELAKGKGEARPRWYVNGQGQTMVVIPGPVELRMGSPPGEEGRSYIETWHRRRIGRAFAIAATSVTVEQILRFRASYEYSHLSPTGDCPMPGQSFYQAAEYCNWLSKQEGLPDKEWCYGPNKEGKYEEGMKLAPDYLKRTGYRLPTEAEWEFACRAGAVTSRYYGESETVLEKYAWYLSNANGRTWPVASLKPNDLGLFDMHGNVWTWCENRYLGAIVDQGGKGLEDKEEGLIIKDKESRVLRGGSFSYAASSLRSAGRNWLEPTYRNPNVGIRLARTIR